MLARSSRVTTADDYRSVVRRGARFTTANAVTYVRRNEGGVRFGFIVSKKVGIAVVRNRVRRRLKAAAFDAVPRVTVGVDVVFRALPVAATASFADLKADVERSLSRADVLRTDEAVENVVMT